MEEKTYNDVRKLKKDVVLIDEKIEKLRTQKAELMNKIKLEERAMLDKTMKERNLNIEDVISLLKNKY